MQYVVTPFRPVDARTLASTLTAENIQLPAPLAKAVALADAADAARRPPHPEVLDLTPEELLNHAIVLAAYAGANEAPIVDALISIAEQGALEAAEALRAGGIDSVIEALRPRFDEAAAVVDRAAKLGITSSTTAADIIERDDPRVVDAWRALKPAIARLNEIATLRVMLSATLDVAPRLSDVRNAAGSTLDVHAVDYSSAFVEPSTGGFTVDGSAYLGRRPGGGIDWLKLAGGGLRLNTPAEAAAMLAERAGLAVHVPLDQNPRFVLGEERRTAHRDDQTVYVG